MRELVRKHIRELVPYKSARSEFKGEAEVYLDANENPYDSQFNRYRDPYQQKLKERLASIRGLNKDKLFFGNGSDEIIDLLIRTFCEPKTDSILSCKPGFSMYRFAAELNDIQHDEFELTSEFKIEWESFKMAVKPEHKLIFLCTPNNPTGNAIPIDVIKKVVEHAPGLVIVDEAYIDFSDIDSCLEHIDDKKLIVLQTFSKSFGSAGIRLGIGIMNPEIVQILNAVKLPYNVSESTQQLANQLLDDYDKVIQSVLAIKGEREKVRQQLEEITVVKKVHQSDANFLLVKFDKAKEVYQYLLNNGFIVRDRSNLLHCESCLRITIGLPDENERLLSLLKSYSK